jgi:hypothetical protein
LLPIASGFAVYLFLTAKNTERAKGSQRFSELKNILVRRGSDKSLIPDFKSLEKPGDLDILT